MTVRLARGALSLIDMADEPARVLPQVAGLIVAEAEAAGVADGEIGPPKKRTDHPFWGAKTAEVPGAFYPQLLLRARRFGEIRPSTPPAWVEPLLEWLLGVEPPSEVWVAVSGIPFRAPARAAKAC